MTTTDRRTIIGGPAGDGGYRSLVDGPAAARRERSELAFAAAGPAQPLLVLLHLADLHICDAQSPGRAELLDRYADPDQSPEVRVPAVGTYRSHELLTTQTALAMVSALNEVVTGPVTGAPVGLAVVTGDAVDSGQGNELAWYLALLDGGEVHPDSGDLTRYEGVADDVLVDERYWHPDSERADLPRAVFGFPTVPGLLGAARRPFVSPGLRVPWLAVNGNHDGLVQGTLPPAYDVDGRVTGSAKPVALPEGWTEADALAVLAGLEAAEPDAVSRLVELTMRTVTADPARRTLQPGDLVRAHDTPVARPPGHGFDLTRPELAYYRHDLDGATVLTLDTVNPHGNWEGSLDVEQLTWLDGELAAADADRRLVVLASHHPLHRLTNARSSGEHRVLAAELDALLARHPSAVLWLDGHTHTNAITPHGAGHTAWWEVTAPAVVDYPQQARVVELSRVGDRLRLDVTNVDHAGPAPWPGTTDGPEVLAGLARELSANDWQTRDHDIDELPRAGTPTDRSATLWLVDPFGTGGM